MSEIIAPKNPDDPYEIRSDSYGCEDLGQVAFVYGEENATVIAIAMDMQLVADEFELYDDDALRDELATLCEQAAQVGPLCEALEAISKKNGEYMKAQMPEYRPAKDDFIGRRYLGVEQAFIQQTLATARAVLGDEPVKCDYENCNGTGSISFEINTSVGHGPLERKLIQKVCTSCKGTGVKPDAAMEGGGGGE